MIETACASRRRRITASDVTASFDQARGKEYFCVAWVGRPLSNYCTPLFYNLGWSANGVTILRSILAAGAVLALCSGSPAILVAAAVLYYVTFVLDCVDGNLARLHDSATYWGKFIDGLSDAIYWILAPLATGIGLWMNGNNDVALMAGALTTVLVLFTELVRNRISFFREWMVAQTGPLTSDDEGARVAPQRIEQAMASIVVNGLFFAPLLLFLPNGAGYYLAALGIVQVPTSVVWLIAMMLHGRAILKRRRKSIHAAVNAFDRDRTV